MPTLSDEIEHWSARTRTKIAEHAPEPRLEQVGYVEQIGDGVATISGLPDARLNELLVFESGTFCMVHSLNERDAGCVMLGPDAAIRAGDRVHGTGEVIRAPVGETILGRVVDPAGHVLDGGPPLRPVGFEPIEKPAPTIIDRDLVCDPLMTGLIVVDAMIPLGRGQRQLIIGDRSTGKTAVAVDTIISQRETDVICIYAAVGQKASSINQVIQSVEQYGAMDRCVFVVAQADGAPGLQWAAPFAACTMGEFFVRQGKDVLIVFDDLTKHAAIYRQLSLLLRNPPGREAYPGDIFYLHARLLERSAKLNDQIGGGSLTALPIVETQSGNLSAYIPTNLISITDGQIYLEAKLFNEGMRPAVNVGKSVSRVGGRTQSPAIKALAESLRLDYAQFLELEIFTRFSATADERTQKIIEHGRRIRAILVQPQFQPLSMSAQTALLLALCERAFDGIPIDRVKRLRGELLPWLDEHCATTMDRIEKSGTLPSEDRETLLSAITSFVQTKPEQ